MEIILLFIRIFFGAMSFLVFFHVILTLFLPADRPLRVGISRIVTPILAPFRNIMKPINGIDFSPVLAILVINLAEWLLSRLVVRLFGF
ncbi:MAG: YggT family protein [Chloroflexi bacterium]|nr:YggT family protein [Chloroflexota bacterium]